MNKKLLFKLLQTPSISGNELAIQKMLIEELKDIDDTIITHHSYNTVHVVNKESKIKVMLLAHIDEIGLVIEKIEDNGICKLTNVGAIKPQMYMGQHVWVVKFDSNGQYTYIPGVIGYPANYNCANISVNDLNLDLGCHSREETLKLVQIGDMVIHQDNVQELANHLLTSRALDDKIGVFICAEVLKRVKTKTTNGVYFVATVGEETTGRGAYFASDMVNPTCAIVLDVGSSTDVKYKEKFTHEVSLGGGPILTIASNANQKLVELLKESAKRLNIPLQYAVEIAKTYTDFDTIYKKNKGIPSELISIPLRYMHSATEVCSLDDIQYIIELLVDFIINLDKHTNFNLLEV